MATVWVSLKKSLHCKSQPSDVVNPKLKAHQAHQAHDHPPPPPPPHLRTILTRKPPRSGCSRSIANLKDVVIPGSKRQIERPPSCSPRSIGSSEFLNPITHEVVFDGNSKCELKITGFGDDNGGGIVGCTLRPGTPGPEARLGLKYNPSPQRKSPLSSSVFGNGGGILQSSATERASLEAAGFDGGYVGCQRCGEQFGKWEALEAHHLSKHAVTELPEGDSSRKIVEIICRTSWLKSESNCGRIERVLKVHNMQKTLDRFEEYRESVKIKASKLPKKHPRCLADGNELLRFYVTTIGCSLGVNGSSSLCTSEKCDVCRIIRQGFSTKKGELGVFTTSTSGRAFETIEVYEENPSIRKALIVCRVIAGRVHKPLDNFQQVTNQSGFDSLAGKAGLYSNIEELYLLNPTALLPCFVVICKV